mgnify:CR=1 FL=1
MPRNMVETLLGAAVLAVIVATAALLTSAIFGIFALNAESEFEDGVTAVRNASTDEDRAAARDDALSAAERADDMAFFDERVEKGIVKKLQSIVESEFVRT